MNLCTRDTQRAGALRPGRGVSGWKKQAIFIAVLLLGLLGMMPAVRPDLNAYASETQKEQYGWKTEGGNTYYIDSSGKKVTGVRKIGGKYYYFNKYGVKKTGWRKVKGVRYYFDPEKDGSRAKGWTNIKGRRYYFKANGKPRTGWFTKSGKYYYLNSNGRAAVGWKTIDGKKYYFQSPSGERVSGTVTIGGVEYTFDGDGALVNTDFSNGKFIDSTGSSFQRASLKKLLQTALKPVGTTLYIWGGGWNKSKDGSITGRTMGVSSYWKTFFDSQDKKYDYTKYRYHYEKGLDCSGFVGWVIYNTFNTASGHQSFVMLAQNMAKSYSGYGWGSYRPAGSVTDFKAGDIMSLAAGHVYIVIGQCSDGSVVLVHASPPGVMLTGTATRSGDKNSEAVQLATSYMKRFYPAFYAKFPDTSRDASYLTGYQQMRWYTTSKSLMTDPENYRNKDAKTILKDLFGS